ncbi:hypothetical protein KZZ52_37450 [Dactylosporangium sp. AC04546]|uniref:hypothetical protein n=1 Tax=Dactylosporangium sp. AC04546 TaxID=2862460 RepID=UPI001EDD9EA3|nr:hypothetical protein [Dactylosporangium sp. AC04546]WVK79651.1 hypothetical protein KZZ52_37450 [Dactylosporangium sp. AC04546]
MRVRVLGVAIAALLAVGGCAEDSAPAGEPTAQPAQSQSQTQSAAESSSSAAASSPSAAGMAMQDDFVAGAACRGIYFAGKKMRDPEEVITKAEMAAGSRNNALAAVGKRLLEQTKAAQAAKGTADEQRTVDAMVATVREVLAMCAEAGLVSGEPSL